MALVNTKVAEDYYALLQRLYGKTYGSQSEDSIFQRQLRSWAVLLATGRSEIDRAFRNAFPGLANELVSEWERAFNLPNDSARSLAERQARLVAHEKEQRGSARSPLQAVLDATGVTASFVANRRDEVLMADSEDAAIFQTTLQLANEDFYDPLVREAVETLFHNALPGKNVGALDRLGAGQSTCVEVGAEWNSTSHFTNRDAMLRQVSDLREERAVHSRVRSYGPGSRIDAEDLNAIQETLLGSALDSETGLTDYSAVNAGLLTRWFSYALAAGVPQTVDDSIDWRDRMVFIDFAESTAQDIRPGEAEDDQYGGSVGSVPKHIYVYTGSGVSGSNYQGHSASTGGDHWSAYCDGSNDLVFEATGSLVNVTGVLWATEKLGKR